MIEYYFYDTSSLLLDSHLEDILQDENRKLVISSITINELENIKTSASKDDDIKYRARQLVRLLDKYLDKFEIYQFYDYMTVKLKSHHVINNDDIKILASAVHYDAEVHPDETVFVTNDLVLKQLAHLYFGEDSILSIEEDEDEYVGYKEIQMSDEEMAQFYEHQDQNNYGLLINEYLIVKNKDGQVVDQVCWTEYGFRHIDYCDFSSQQLGTIKPMKDDIQQALLMDSFKNNQITLVRGPAGSGKSVLSLGYLFYALEKHKIDHLVIFCNPVAAKNSARLGFYPGTRNEKLLDSQVGNFLSSKLGSRMELERLITQEKIILLPLSDCRGYDTSGMRAGVYITEAQNMDIPLMKLALQRIGQDSICILDGDDKLQVDLDAYEGKNNGMRRVSEIFRGSDVYGEIRLNTVHRSRIGAIAEKM